MAAAIAPGGFEPPFSDPKTDVLPLDEGAGADKLLYAERLNNIDRGRRAANADAVFRRNLGEIGRPVENPEDRRPRPRHPGKYRSRAAQSGEQPGQLGLPGDYHRLEVILGEIRDSAPA